MNTDYSNLSELCSSLRNELIDVTSRQGGHLAPSLGTVELCVALHKIFDIGGKDAVFFDVSHQAYAHKLLSGRKEAFQNLRSINGCSGFSSPAESTADPVAAGHAGVAISQALGFAKAKELQNQPGRAIAVVGDGALGCGISWEAFNNLDTGGSRLIVILNDNQMSISPNSGAFRNILNRIITGRFYNRIRKSLHHKNQNIFRRAIRRIEHGIKAFFLGKGVFFQEFGFRYFGPIDGNNIKQLCSVLKGIPEGRPALLHIVTRKGFGYQPAEQNPELFHCVPPFDKATGKFTKSGALSFSSSCANALCNLAELHPDLVAISPAMLDGTGLARFAEKFPDRCFDTGISENHALAFASGLAADNLRPVVCIYSTFLQRALDNVYHDICLNNLPVIICVDRTGCVPDGPTHHGLYATSFLAQLPNITILSPADDQEMKLMLEFAYNLKSPVIIQYPRGNCGKSLPAPAPIALGKASIVSQPTEKQSPSLIVWACGAEVARAQRIISQLPDASRILLVNARFLHPFDSELAAKFPGIPHVVIDDGTANGVLETELQKHLPPDTPLTIFAWPSNTIIPHGSISELQAKFTITDENIRKALVNIQKFTQLPDRIQGS